MKMLVSCPIKSLVIYTKDKTLYHTLTNNDFWNDFMKSTHKYYYKRRTYYDKNGKLE